jgi:hypothetical protein
MAIKPRRIEFPFDLTTVPKYWFGGNATASLKASALNLIFPDGERFFIRAVRHHLPQLDDPELKAEARRFFAQEALHGNEHNRANEVLIQQGLELDSWLEWYRHVAYRRLEPMVPPILCLSITAALEHLTASMGHYTLRTDTLRHAVPAMQDLLRWHSAEEIEHKAVAFDVFEAVDGRWTVRVLGMVCAVGLLLFFWRSAWRHLSRQDDNITRRQMRADLKQIKQEWKIHSSRNAILGYALSYLRPGFHPNDMDDYALAKETLDQLEARYLASAG